MIADPIFDDPLIPEAESYYYTGKKPKTLANERCAKRNQIPYLKIGARIYYRLSDLKAHRLSCLVMPEKRMDK